MKNTICDKRYALSKWRIIFVLSLVWLILPLTAQAAEYYLDAVNGDNANPGTAEQPWKTLNRTYTWYSGSGPKVQEGDTVLFRNGSYGTFSEHTNDGAQYLFYRNNWITYKADVGHNPILDSISIQNADKWGEIEHGRSYLIFEGFRILSGVGIAYTSYAQVRNCNITLPAAPYTGFYAPYFYPGWAAVEGRTAHFITIENNDISNAYRGIGLTDGTDNAVVRNNIIHIIGEDGIVTSGASQLLLEGNTISDIHPYRTVINIYGTKTGDFIQGEKVILQGTAAEGIFYRHTPRTGYDIIDVWQTTQTDFKEEWKAGRGNTIIGQTSGATLYITNVDPAHCDAVTLMPGTEIIFRRNKLIRRYGGGADGQGLKLDRPQNVTIENNLIDTGKPMIAEGMNGCHIYNNAFYGADGIEFYSGRDTVVDNFHNNFVERFVQRSDGAGIVWIKNHGNNIIGPAQKGNTYGGPAHPFVINATEMQITDANALFVDITNGDFRLKENSVAIDFGNPDYGPKTDILGNLRDAQPDAGCYEYGASTFLYGDVSGNGEISAYDAALTAQYSVGLITLTPDQITAADVSGNGEVSAYDAALIAQKAVGLIEKFPVEGG